MPSSIPNDPEDSSPDPTEVAARRIGEVFADKWRIERVLGSGGMATVYAAVHTNNQRTVALKVLHTELTASGDVKKRFLREGFIANRIGHPGAVAILDDGVDDKGNVFLVMELLTGASIADRIRADGASAQSAARSTPADAPDGSQRRAFSEAEALRIADGVLDVLIAAHAQGIVHRDLKPDNVFLTDAGDVKVLDFGIARLREPQSGETPTLTGVLLGTPQYMPPEQARGRSSLVDGRSDLWAVGAIVFTMLTGRHVHEAETPNESLLKAMTATAPPIASLLPDIDPKVAAIVDRALAFDQEKRYPDARAMQEDVRGAMALLGPGSTDLAPPTSGGTALSAPRPITGASKSSTPMVRDANWGRSGGWRVLAVVLTIGLCAIGGRALLARYAPRMHATTDERPDPVNGTLPTTIGTTVPVTLSGTDGGAPLAGAVPTPFADAAPPASAVSEAPGPILDAAADADSGDADTDDDSDDDGGDEDEEVTIEFPPSPAGHAPHALIAPHRSSSPSPPSHPSGKGEPPKKRHKKKKKR
ncbi:MAG: serine/threonine-protein kinase [Polyangiaceae bacterium]